MLHFTLLVKTAQLSALGFGHSIGFLDSLSKLVRLINPNSPPVIWENFVDILSHNGAVVICTLPNKNDDPSVLGVATLVPIYKLNGISARIEHVAVFPAHQGKRIGKLMSEMLIAHAKSKGYRYVDLTSEPSKIPANRLYQKLGFKVRSTNVYRHDLNMANAHKL
jgi:ribosomal protein S18 acetylase RimI-like enzyme